MTLLKDNNYRDINIALLSLENDIKNKNFDTSAIDAQLADINKRINEINANTGGDISAEIDVINNKINDIRLNINNINNDISNVNTEIDTINSDVDIISTEIETLQGQVSSNDEEIENLENKVTINTNNIANLQTQLNSKAPKTGSSSNFQSNTHYYKSLGGFSDFDYVVVPILDISSSTGASRYSSGKLFTHRSNGLFSDQLVEWKCNKSYNSTASEKYSLTVYKKSDDYWRFCTFTYNNVKYLGVAYNRTTASVNEVYFDGYTSSMTSPLFTVIKYNDTQDGVTNTEIYNSLTILETEEYHALNSETEKKREKTWYGSHGSYIKLGSIPVSSGTVYFVNLDIDIRSANGDASYPTGKINANISSGSYSTGFNINGYSTIDISNTSSTLYPRLIVEKTSTDYNVYIYCSYNYIAIKVSDEYNNGWEAASFTESASLSGTTVYDSSTSNAIINIKDLQRKDSAVTFESKNGYNGLGANGNYTAWLRTPVSGIIPYDARSNTTSSKLGTSNWKFAEVNALTVNAETINADTLNGNATSASSWAYSELDLTSQSNGNFYPVIIKTGQYGFADVEIASQGEGTAPYNQNRIKFTLSASGWSDTPKSLFISEYACYDTDEITIGCIGYGTQSFGHAVIWLRGGIKYYCRTMNTSLTLKTESYTEGNSTVTVGANYYGGTNTQITILFTPQTTTTNGLYTNRSITAPAFRGNATSATKLETARSITTNLASTDSASFDGTEDITPGVTGTLPVANGGTGKTTLEAAANSLINGLSTSASTPSDNDYFISQYASGGTTTTTYHRRPLYALWNWIKGKVSSVLGLSEGKLNIRGTTYSTVTATDDNPHIEFAETNGTQPVRLTYTSYDTYQSPASLTLVGGQGGEYFIAPNIKATSNFYGSLSGNATSATRATTATRATQDGGGNTITSTYIKNLSSNGSTLTYTKGDNSTGTIDMSRANPVGTILAWAGSSSNVPLGYLICDGSSVSRTTYADLFSVIGTTFGTPSSTTFRLPDLRSRFIEGATTTAPLNYGTYVGAGLPNIIGSQKEINHVSIWDSSPTGAFASSASTGENTYNGTSSGSNFGTRDICLLDFNARDGEVYTNGNPKYDGDKVYGNSNTVQPAALCLHYIIKY